MLVLDKWKQIHTRHFYEVYHAHLDAMIETYCKLWSIYHHLWSIYLRLWSIYHHLFRVHLLEDDALCTHSGAEREGDAHLVTAHPPIRL